MDFCKHSDTEKSEYCEQCKKVCCLPCSIDHKKTNADHNIKGVNDHTRDFVLAVDKKISLLQPTDAFIQELDKCESDIQQMIEKSNASLTWLKAEINKAIDNSFANQIKVLEVLKGNCQTVKGVLANNRTTKESSSELKKRFWK